MSERIRDYVQYLVESLVDDTEAVKVSDSYEDGELYVDVEVADDERGRVIGKNGRLIRSMRVIVRAAAGRDGERATVELLEPDDGPASSDGDGDAAPADSDAAE